MKLENMYYFQLFYLLDLFCGSVLRAILHIFILHVKIQYTCANCLKLEVYLSSYNVDGTITDADGFVIPNLTIQDADDVTPHDVPKVKDPKPQKACSRSFFPGVPLRFNVSKFYL